MTRFILNLAVAFSLLAGIGGFVQSAVAGPSTNPTECFQDDGHAGYRPCSGGNGA